MNRRRLMRLLVLSLFIPLAMIVLSYGQASVHIGGNDGLALLKNLTKSSSNLTDDNLTNNALINTIGNTANTAMGNLSIDSNLQIVPRIIGNGGKVLAKNLSNSSLNLTGVNNTSNLWNWGGKPLAPPVPTAEDYFNYQGADVVKANRVE
jgi:hypothetical protein